MYINKMKNNVFLLTFQTIISPPIINGKPRMAQLETLEAKVHIVNYIM